MTISSKNRFLSLVLILGLFSNSLSVATVDQSESRPKKRKLANKNYWANATTNIHQPVYTPGFGPYHAYSPMFLVPPPPQVAFSNLIPPTQTFMPSEKPIKRKVNVVSYPQHLDNPTNYYSHPRFYNPFFGSQHPVNLNHPYNFLHGPAPFPSYGQPNYLPGFAGMAGAPGIGSRQANIPIQNLNAASVPAQNIGQANLPTQDLNQAQQGPSSGQSMPAFGGPNIVNPMAAPFGNVGFSTNPLSAINQYLSNFNAEGNRSPYNEPGRRLGQVSLAHQPEFIDFNESTLAKSSKRHRFLRHHDRLKHII